MVDFKIGADPEFFLLDTETGKHVSAFNMVPGTKHDPFEVEGGAVQVDGMALEFNIDPASTFPEFEKNIGKVLKQLREMVPARYAFDFTPVAHFGQEYIDSQPDEAKALGCDPDFNAWDNGAINPKPDGNRGIRTASGHIHIGWTQDQDATDPEHIQACIMLTKQLDYYLGTPSLMWDTDSLRRSMYGAPGAFRPKRYGVEYRVLSNLWVNNPSLRSYVYHMALSGAQTLMAGKRVYNKFTPNFINWLFDYADWGEITDAAMAYPKFVRDDNFHYMSGLRDTVRNTDRPERANYEQKLKEGFFYYNPDSSLIDWDDVNSDDYSPDLYSNPYHVYQIAKANGEPKPEWKENEVPKYTINLETGVKPWAVKKGIPVKDKMKKMDQLIIDDFAKVAQKYAPGDFANVAVPAPKAVLDDPFAGIDWNAIGGGKKNGLEF